MRDYVGIANKYVDDVLTGKILSCESVKRACERQRNDLARWPDATHEYHFDSAKASRVCKFIELLPHIKGPLAGQCIQLEPWQIFILTTSFGWVKQDGTRRFRRAYIEVPRGNGKSAISSGVGLYCLCGDGEGGAEVYSFATTRDQAKIVFGDAQAMARKAPGLRKSFGVEVLAHNINQLRTGSKFEAKSADGHTLDGLNIHLGIIDELHAHKTRAVYDVVETGCGKRPQSLLWVITTAGFDRTGICYEVRGYVDKVLKGVVEDETQFGIIYTIDEDDDWATEEALIKANPNWGVSVVPGGVLPLLKKAISTPSATNNFLTKHLNVWVNANSAWMDMRAWEKCADPSLSISDFYGQPVTIGLDLASKKDIAAKLYIFKHGEKFAIFGRYYLPMDAIESSRNSQYGGWVRDGKLIGTPGAVTDFDLIQEELREDAQKFDLTQCAFDPFQATQMTQQLSNEGLMMVEVKPTVLNFSEPMKQLEALVLSGRLVHDGCPVLTWMMSNVVCHVDAKDNIYPRKEKDENKIDGPVALITALSRIMVEPEKKTSVYEQRGFVSF